MPATMSRDDITALAHDIRFGVRSYPAWVALDAQLTDAEEAGDSDAVDAVLVTMCDVRDEYIMERLVAVPVAQRDRILARVNELEARACGLI